jgi:hypothetical protein
MSRWIRVCLALAPLFLFAGCGGGGGGSSSSTPLSVNAVSCSSVSGDSTLSGSTPTLNTAWDKGSPTYNLITTRKDASGTAVTVAYMFHPSVGTAKGLIVLFVGGQGTANLTTSDGTHMSGAGVTFEARSANMFAAQGFDVATIDRPSDESTSYTYNYQYDTYRTSMRAAVDISSVINSADTTGLPVFFEGSSRGTVSAASNSILSSGIAVASPVTSGNGDPIGGGSSVATVQAASIHVPMQVTWNTKDTCSVTVPANSKAMAQTFLNAGVTITATAITGGPGDYPNPGCVAAGYHQYFTIETCSVQQQTDWATTVATGLSSGGNSRPTAQHIFASTTAGTSLPVDLSGSASDTDGDTLTYSLPYTTSSLGGTLTLSGSSVTYTPPSSSTYTAGTDDSFVYVVSDGKGGTANNVVSVTLN